jgi:hypothetical protein
MFKELDIAVGDRLLLINLANQLQSKALESSPKGSELKELVKAMAVEEGDASDDEPLPVLDDDGVGMKPLPGNGGVAEYYEWAQSSKDVDCKVQFGQKLVKTLVDVEITSTRARVGLKGEAPLVNGELCHKVHDSECFWTIEDDGTCISVHLCKAVPGWWSCVIRGDPEINVRKIQPETTPLEELDEEMQQSVNKIMWDQKAKALGLQSSKEIEGRAKLKDFLTNNKEWDFSEAEWN